MNVVSVASLRSRDFCTCRVSLAADAVRPLAVEGTDRGQWVLLDYAVALTCEPEERTAADIERLREYGFGDAEIASLRQAKVI